jgi:PEP-CTERM motif
MNCFKLIAVLSLGVLCSAVAHAQCPAYGDATGCTTDITITPTGTLTVSAGTGGTTYDGVDDQLVGFTNDSGLTITSISLNGGSNDIFGFDGDGIDTYGAPGNSIDTTGYGGPDVYFTNINASDTIGTVNFINAIAPGGTTYVSLEEPISAPHPLRGAVGGTPEPSTLLLLGTGILGLAARIRSRIVPS